MAAFDRSFIDEVRSKNDIVDVVGQYVKLTRRGSRYLGLCPFHSEKTPSFTVRPDDGFFYCFGCQKGGDVIRFLQEREGISFYDAVVQLAQRAHLTVPRPERTPQEEEAFREREQMAQALDLATRFFQHNLRHVSQGKRALEYLYSRGLTDATIDRFRIGYALPGWDNLLRVARGRIAERILQSAGLVLSGQRGLYDAFRDRVMFPIADARGRVVGFGGRILPGSEEGAKYYNSPETPFFTKRRHLFALDLAKQSVRQLGQAVIVEGYMDAIACHQAGVTNVVASLGTALTAEQSQLVRQQAPVAVIAYDADLAGQAATLKGLDTLSEAGCEVRVLSLPRGKDPDEFIRSEGAEAFSALLQAAQPLIEFKLRLALARTRGQSAAERRSAAAADVLPVLAQIGEAVRREEYLRWVAGELAGSGSEAVRIEDALRTDLRGYLRNQGYRSTGSRNNIRGSGLHELPEEGVSVPAVVQRAERTLLRLALLDPSLLGRVDAALQTGFELPLHMEVAATLKEAAAGGDAAGLVGRAMGRLQGEESIRLLAELAEGDYPTLDPAREAAECIETIRKHRLTRRIGVLGNLISSRRAAGQEVEREVMLEYQQLLQQLKGRRN